MKKFLLESFIILVLSVAVGLGYNQFFLKNPLPVFSRFDPHKVDVTIVSQKENVPVVDLNEVDGETMQSLVESDSAVLIDARAAQEYESGHIPTALSLPVAEFKNKYQAMFSTIPKEKTIIVYCIGGLCTDSSLLGSEFVHKGHPDIFVYKGGIEEWQAQGKTLVTGKDPGGF